MVTARLRSLSRLEGRGPLRAGFLLGPWFQGACWALPSDLATSASAWPPSSRLGKSMSAQVASHRHLTCSLHSDPISTPPMHRPVSSGLSCLRMGAHVDIPPQVGDRNSSLASVAPKLPNPAPAQSQPPLLQALTSDFFSNPHDPRDWPPPTPPSNQDDRSVGRDRVFFWGKGAAGSP